jgi:osmoprotectant transport system permease protein
MTWVVSNWSFIVGLTLTHLAVSVVPIVLGAILGIALARIIPNRFAGATRGILGSIYAIPSLALFVTLPVILGTSFIGPTNVVIALTIYVVASFYFSARDAFAQVPPATLVTATALGMNARQLFFHVELPLAVPGLIAGLRVATASTLAIASIGAVVGVRNLGYLFVDGFQRKIPEEIVSGILAIFVISLILDVALWLLGRALTPWRRVRTAHA